MEIALSRQSAALLAALLMGVGIGVLYDLLRPLRRRSGALAGGVLDTLFCLASGCAAFAYAMGIGDGRLGVWALAGALLGFLLYLHSLSDWLLPLFTALVDAALRAAAFLKKTLGRALLLTKKGLASVREWAAAPKKPQEEPREPEKRGRKPRRPRRGA